MGTNDNFLTGLRAGEDDAYPVARDGARGMDLRTWLIGQVSQGSIELVITQVASTEDVAQTACDIADAVLERMEATRRRVITCHHCNHWYLGRECPRCNEQGVDLANVGSDLAGEDAPLDRTERLVPRPGSIQTPGRVRPRRPEEGGL